MVTWSAATAVADNRLFLWADELRPMLVCMTGRENTEAPGAVGQPLFATTHWSVVRQAAAAGSLHASAAMEELCRTYWYPLYAYARRYGKSPQDAQDLTQAFFAHLLSQEFLKGVSPEKGKFRSFLLACFKHFMADEWEKARTAKRGGGVQAFALSVEGAENRYCREPSTETNPESLYERRWAMDLLDHVLDQLQSEAAALGKQTLFDRLQGCLLGEHTDGTYAQLGASLNLSETAVKMAVHRLRLRYREVLRGEIARTVAHPDEVEEEMRYLFGVVSQ